MKFENLKEKKIKLEKILESAVLNNQEPVDFQDFKITLPLVYRAKDAYMFFFTASKHKVRGLINSSRVDPITVSPGKCLFALTVFDYEKCAIGPYNEIALSIPVRVDSISNFPVLSLILDYARADLHMHTLLLAMNNGISRDHSSEIFGYPTYHKSIFIKQDKKESFVMLESGEGEEGIFKISFDVRCQHKNNKDKFNTVFIKDDKICKVELHAVSNSSFFWNPKRVDVKWGNHYIANTIKGLGVSNEPLALFVYEDVFEILGKPVNLGRA